jgi:hypothetical protein
VKFAEDIRSVPWNLPLPSATRYSDLLCAVRLGQAIEVRGRREGRDSSFQLQLIPHNVRSEKLAFSIEHNWIYKFISNVQQARKQQPSIIGTLDGMVHSECVKTQVCYPGTVKKIRHQNTQQDLRLLVYSTLQTLAQAQ